MAPAVADSVLHLSAVPLGDSGGGGGGMVALVPVAFGAIPVQCAGAALAGSKLVGSWAATMSRSTDSREVCCR